VAAIVVSPFLFLIQNQSQNLMKTLGITRKSTRNPSWKGDKWGYCSDLAMASCEALTVLVSQQFLKIFYAKQQKYVDKYYLL